MFHFIRWYPWVGTLKNQPHIHLIIVEYVLQGVEFLQVKLDCIPIGWWISDCWICYVSPKLSGKLLVTGSSMGRLKTRRLGWWWWWWIQQQCFHPFNLVKPCPCSYPFLSFSLWIDLLGNFKKAQLLPSENLLIHQPPNSWKDSGDPTPHLFKVWWSKKKKTTNVSGGKKTEMFHGQKFSYPFDVPKNKKKHGHLLQLPKKKHIPNRNGVFGIFPPPAICCVATWANLERCRGRKKLLKHSGCIFWCV